jgi:hypothetical protein
VAIKNFVAEVHVEKREAELERLVLRLLVVCSSSANSTKEVLAALAYADRQLGHTTSYEFYINVNTIILKIWTIMSV